MLVVRYFINFQNFNNQEILFAQMIISKKTIRRGCEPANKIWIYEIKNGIIPRTDEGILPWMKLFDTFEDKYVFIANNETEFHFCTTLNAPRKRMIAIDIETRKR